MDSSKTLVRYSILVINRSPTNFVVNLLAGLIAYCHGDKKPSIAIDELILDASA
ncbi:MAG: hypothetical protein ACFCAD_03900 [Pleurocapsa sp.]